MLHDGLSECDFGNAGSFADEFGPALAVDVDLAVAGQPAKTGVDVGAVRVAGLNTIVNAFNHAAASLMDFEKRQDGFLDGEFGAWHGG